MKLSITVSNHYWHQLDSVFNDSDMNFSQHHDFVAYLINLQSWYATAMNINNQFPCANFVLFVCAVYFFASWTLQCFNNSCLHMIKMKNGNIFYITNNESHLIIARWSMLTISSMTFFDKFANFCQKKSIVNKFTNNTVLLKRWNVQTSTTGILAKMCHWWNC